MWSASRCQPTSVTSEMIDLLRVAPARLSAALCAGTRAKRAFVSARVSKQNGRSVSEHYCAQGVWNGFCKSNRFGTPPKQNQGASSLVP